MGKHMLIRNTLIIGMILGMVPYAFGMNEANRILDQKSFQVIIADPSIPTEVRDAPTQSVAVLAVVERASDEYIASWDYTSRYKGSKISRGYFNKIYLECGDSQIKQAIAIATAETSQGRNTSNKTNFFGYHPRGDKGYDPSEEVMAKDICKLLSGIYMDLIPNGVINRQLAICYVNGCKSDKQPYNWIGNVESAMRNMR